MVLKLKKLLTSMAALFVVASPLAFAGVTHAQANIEENLNSGACLNVNGCTTDDTDPSERVNNIIESVINIFSLVVGVVAVIMIIIGGLKYITSGGDSGNVTGAKNTILYAVIGLVVVALAQIIVRFVLTRTAGTAS